MAFNQYRIDPTDEMIGPQEGSIYDNAYESVDNVTS